MSAIDQIIRRMLNIYGEPKCDDPAGYLAEMREALRGYSDAALARAGDLARNECKWFPKPAELRDLASRAAAEAYKPEQPARDADMPQRTPEQIARAQALMDEFRRNMAGKFIGSRDVVEAADASRPAFEAMQRSSRNGWLHRKAPGLTERSRRMTGDE